ncbi:hypothetical protein EVJ58_g7058 [Rhodofomes roseus]|uniref:Glutamine synthetase n=1 Tax=Rhodofomes roseus TaxID=34475 RepID=A0A4Y9Y4F6_9APHY|nr:hypothetical protein EVJ58_g7058 [Rhodofomes roseus]
MSQIGILYKPEQASKPKYASVHDLQLEERGIRYVRVQWVDLVNTVRFRILPASYFTRLFETARPGVCLSKVTLGLVGVNMAEGFSGTGEHLYVVDLNSFRLSPYAPGHAVLMGWFQEKTPLPNGSLATPLCPRTLLKNIVNEAQTNAGLSFLAGFESEFILLSATSPKPVTLNNAGWSCAAKFRTGTVENTVLQEIADNLQDAGVELQMIHAESAPGQFEVVTGGNGAHVHFSVHSSRPPTSGTRRDAALAPTLTATERSFLQGILEHLPALCALTLPTSASYARMADGIWSGGTYSSWGLDNKDTPIRLCGSQGAHHFEMKTADGTSNPYLVLAGTLAAGLRGVLTGAELKSGDCAKPVAFMSEDERKAVGLENPLRLPRTVGDARERLQEDEQLREMLGDEFVTKYVAVLEKFLKLPSEEETITHLVEYY